MTFLYPFMNFFQPGIYWRGLAPFMPMMVLSMIALLVGFAKKTSYPRNEVFTHPTFYWLTAFLLLQPVSLFATGISGILTGFAYWVVYFVFVVASILLMSDEKALGRYVFGMMAGSMFIVVFGICAVMYHWPEALGGRAGAYGMYENHNDYSFLIIQILPFLYMYRRVSENFFIRLFLGVSLIACVLGILLSLSRGGMLAMLLEFALIILIGMEGRKRLLWIPILVIVSAAAIGYQWAKRAENQGDNYTAADAENSRFELWRAGANMMLNHPLLGVGSLHYSEYARFYGEISHDNRGKNTHNTYLEILTGTGVIGLFIFLKMLYGLIRDLHRRPQSQGPPMIDAMRRATLIGIYSILFRATLDAKPHDWSFYVLCAIGIVCVVLQRQADADADAKAIDVKSDAALQR